MELRHLRYFVAVAEEEHITRAAARLGIQQPPLSQQIKLLEQEIGVDLFSRGPRRIALNPAGKVFLSDARRILTQVEEAVARVRQFDLGKEGTVMVGLTGSASMNQRVAWIIRNFREAYPLVSLQIEEGANHDLLNKLEEERLDIAFVRSSADRYPSLAVNTLVQEPMVVALPASHPLAAGTEPIRLTQLRDDDFLMFRRANGSSLCLRLMQACNAAGFRPRIVSETERMISAINMVAAGIGVAVVPKALTSFRLDPVVYRDLDPADNFTLPLNVAYRNSAKSETLRRFLDSCRVLPAAAAA
jgi:DNA-binding transcriptional LysR family regulator